MYIAIILRLVKILVNYLRYRCQIIIKQIILEVLS